MEKNMKQIKYLIGLGIDCEWTDKELEEVGCKVFRDYYGMRYVIYRPINRRSLDIYDIKFWEDIRTIEAFDELEQIKGQMEVEE